MASMSLPIGESSACSVIENTLMPRPPEHRLEGDSMLPLAGESAEFPDENLLEWGIRPGGIVNHPPELGTLGSTATFGLVDILTCDDVVVL